MNLLPLPPSFKFCPYFHPSLRCLTSSFTAVFFLEVSLPSLIKIFNVFFLINLFFLYSFWGNTCHEAGVHVVKQAITLMYFLLLE